MAASLVGLAACLFLPFSVAEAQTDVYVDACGGIDGPWASGWGQQPTAPFRTVTHALNEITLPSGGLPGPPWNVWLIVRPAAGCTGVFTSPAETFPLRLPEGVTLRYDYVHSTQGPAVIDGAGSNPSSLVEIDAGMVDVSPTTGLDGSGGGEDLSWGIKLTDSSSTNLTALLRLKVSGSGRSNRAFVRLVQFENVSPSPSIAGVLVENTPGVSQATNAPAISNCVFSHDVTTSPGGSHSRYPRGR